MKKILSIILALVMVCSLTVTAFAEENSTTLRFITPHIFSITDFETPLDGDTPCDSNSISVSADYDVSFKIYDAYWLHKTAEGAWESVAGNFVAGETYSFLIMVSVDSWRFDTDPIVYINGDDSLVDPSSFSYNAYKNVVTFQTIEMTVEEVNTPSYTFHCPAHADFKYGVGTEKYQIIGDIYVTDVKNCKKIQCCPKYKPMEHIYGWNAGWDTQWFNLYASDGYNSYSLTLSESGQQNNSVVLYNADLSNSRGADANGYLTVTLKALMNDINARPGAIYEGSITYEIRTFS